MRRLNHLILTAVLLLAGVGYSISAYGQCLVTHTLTYTPPLPASGIIPGGTNIEICFEVVEYTNLGSNWFHGIGYNFGPGWDIATLTPTVYPTSCDGNGVWDFYNTVTSGAGGIYGPGFFYDTPAGSPGGVLDGDPGNNYGDNCTLGFGNWIFCVSITTNSATACVDGADLSFTIDVFSDGESGSWSNTSCVAEPPIPSPPLALSCCTVDLFGTDPGCEGDTDGSIIAVGTTTGPFTFDWSTAFSETTPDSSFLSGLGAGLYDVTITDSAGCMSTSTIELFDPPAIDITLLSHIDVACPGGSNGSVEITGMGGTGLPITYSIDGGTPQATGLFTGLAVGTYTFSAIDSIGCTHDTMITIIEDNVLTPVINGFTDVTCFEGTDGQIDASATGGYVPYTYSLDDVTYQAGGLFTGLIAGTYTVYVQDDDGCVVSTTVTITEPAALTVDAGTYIPIPQGGSVLLTPTTPATAVASWIWSPPSGLDCTNCENPNASPSLSTWYTLVITDVNGCTATDSAQVIVSTDIVIPNAFTPNGDNINDFFGIDNPLIDEMELQVFNRWGTELFRTNSVGTRWDGTYQGTEQEMGTYIYVLKVVTVEGLELTKQGSITLIR